MIGSVLKLQDIHRDAVTVCLPESFEWLLLSSGVISVLDAKAVLESPEEHIDSEKFKRWEDFFYKYLRGGGVHADAIMGRIVHNATWVDMGEANMRQRRGTDR